MGKSTGVSRKIDELGRVVIPKEIRRDLELDDGDSVDFTVEPGGRIVIQKVGIYCAICGKKLKREGTYIKLGTKAMCVDCITTANAAYKTSEHNV